MRFLVDWPFCYLSIYWTRENPMSNGCQAINPLYERPEGVIGQFDNYPRGAKQVKNAPALNRHCF